MFARVETSTVQLSEQLSEIDDVISSYHHTVGLVRTLPGNMGGYVLVNRDVGEVLSVTFWNSEEDRTVAESEFEASPHRGRVSVYGVAMQESLKTS
jgi:heme-degrading monooxygenase HmoA